MSATSDLRLNGLNPLSYQGVNPYTPVPFFTRKKAPSAPTVNDYQNFTLGTIWLDQTTDVVYMLVNLNRTDAITTVATWVPFASGYANVQALQGNTGGLVYATGVNPPYINVVGDGTTVTVVGNPASNTLTISTIGTGVVNTLTGNSGGAVSPTLGNINTVGDGVGITIVGNPGTSTLTASLVGGGVAAQTFKGDMGTATPNVSGVMNVVSGQLTLNSGSSVYVDAISNTLTLNVTDSRHNTMIGNLAGSATLSGSNSTALGYQAGSAYTSTEADNVVIGNSPGKVGESGVVRVGNVSGNANANTFVGNASGNSTYTVASSTNCTSIGAGSLALISTGHSCTAVGQGALANCSTSSDNTGIGTQSLDLLETGTGQNTSCGAGSLRNIVTGSYNTSLGYASGYSYTSSESSNITIGNQGTLGESNKIRIGTYGTGAGQQDQAFMAGIVTFTNQVAFEAYQSTTINNVTGDGTTYLIPFDTVWYDTHSNYDASTGVFTAPVDGIYMLSATVSISSFTSSMTNAVFYFGVLGPPSAGGKAFGRYNPYACATSGLLRVNGAISVFIEAGGTAWVAVEVGTDTKTCRIQVTDAGSCWFSCVKIA